MFILHEIVLFNVFTRFLFANIVNTNIECWEHVVELRVQFVLHGYHLTDVEFDPAEDSLRAQLQNFDVDFCKLLSMFTCQCPGHVTCQDNQ